MKTFSSMTDDELVWWFIHFLNGGNWEDPEGQALYEAACDEVAKRGEDMKKKVAYIQEVI